tara:strand:- start:3845 stop:4090 length:246 start_codon:yes stop_codon:yes gene_type:complete
MTKRKGYQARYWCKVQMSPSHSFELPERRFTITEVRSSLMENLAPLEPHWKVTFMRGGSVHNVMYPDGVDTLMKEKNYYAN